MKTLSPSEHRRHIGRRSTVALCYTALGVALLTVCSWLSLPVWTVPFTMQTFAVFFVVGLLGTKWSFLCLLCYLLLGLAGVPVFSGFGAGIARLVGPTGGYIVGFLLSCLVTGPLWTLAKNKPIWQYLSMWAGLAVCYAAGTVWFAYVGGNLSPSGLGAALLVCVVPYLVPDACKLMLALLLVRRLRPILAATMRRIQPKESEA